MKVPCSICGIDCPGKMKLWARSNKKYPVCVGCFGKYELTPMKEIRKLIYRVSL